MRSGQGPQAHGLLATRQARATHWDFLLPASYLARIKHLPGSVRKTLLLFLTAAACATGCSKKADPAGAPFLGHWEAKSVSESRTTLSGQVVDNGTQPYASVLNATAAAFDYSLHRANTQPTLVHFEYRRAGDTLKLTANIGIYTHVLTRSLTPDSFTLETQQDDSPYGKTFTRLTHFHR